MKSHDDDIFLFLLRRKDGFPSSSEEGWKMTGSGIIFRWISGL
jgi:hypothetical protein